MKVSAYIQFLLIAFLACLGGKNIIMAQDDTILVELIDSCVGTTIEKIDFGVITPNANPSMNLEPVDYLAAWSSEQVESLMQPIPHTYQSRIAVAPISDEYDVGQIPYTEDTTPYGGRVYSIPIQVSPMAKLPAQLSLAYNSQSGNGVAGYGWHIGGLHAITICNKNIYYHNAVAPADVNDSNAVYTLDGVPLVMNDDAALYGEYQLETASGHIIVKKHTNDNDVVCYFTALYPDGSKATFGITSNSAARITYPITLLEDRFGNQVIYNYDYDTNYSDYRLDSVVLKNKSIEIGRVTFSYSERSDSHLSYRAGVASYPNDILKGITSISNGSELCTYGLQHAWRDGVNLLSSVTCTNSSGSQLPPLSFSYGEDADEGQEIKDLVSTESLLMSTFFPSTSDVPIKYLRSKMLQGNYNDGLIVLPDFARYDKIDTKWVGLKRRYRYGSPYPANQDIIIIPKITDGVQGSTIKAEKGFQHISAVDVDGNATCEIVKVNYADVAYGQNKTPLKISIYDATTTGVTSRQSFRVNVGDVHVEDTLTSPLQLCYLYGDFKGDGNSQLLTISFYDNEYYSTEQSYVSLIDLNSGNKLCEQTIIQLTLDDYANGKVVCIDLDGDGRTELCHQSGDNVKVYNFKGNSFTQTKSLTVPNLLTSVSHFTDINGDGYVDVAVEPQNSSTLWRIYFYDGNNFIPDTVNLCAKASGDEYMFFDINKDGLSDLIQRRGTLTYMYLNENASFDYARRIQSSLSLHSSSRFVPCNVSCYNDMSDFIVVEDAYVNLYGFTQDLRCSRSLTKFTDSMGAVTVNSYGDMNYTGPEPSEIVYFASSDRTYSASDGYYKTRFPLLMLRNTRKYLTSSLLSDELVGNIYYTYYDACVNNKGLGFSGFGKIRSIDFMNLTDKELVTIQTKDPERMGVITKVESAFRMAQDNPYAVTEYTYDENSTTYGKLNPRMTKVVQTDVLNPIVTTTSYTYDSYDYPTLVSVARSLQQTIAVDVHTYEYDHSAAVSKYILGTLKSDLRTLAIPSSQKFWYEKQVYTHNDLKLPLSCIDYVGSSTASLNKKNETRWTYDGYGNVLTEKSAPYNVSDFVGITYTYDADGVNLLSVKNELNQVRAFSGYNKFGKPLWENDHKGRITSYEYDDWGVLLSADLPDGTVSSTSKSWGGLACYTITKTTTGKPAEIVHYDAIGREVRSGSQRYNLSWIFTDTQYSKNGKIKRVSLPFKSNSSPVSWNVYEYDQYHRPISYSTASGSVTTWTYGENSVTETKDGSWNIKYENVTGQIWKVQDQGGTITYTYRADGQPTSVSVTGGQTTTFEYDIYGRRAKITDPSAGVQTDNVIYNSDGSSILTHTNPNGSVITYVDKYGRTTKVERPGEYTTDYAYDSSGLLTSEISSNGTSKYYTYDSYDRVTTLLENVPDGKWLKKTYTYTSGSNISSIAYQSQSGVIGTENFVYVNGTNIRIGLLGYAVRHLNGENEFGQPTSVSTGGVTRTYTYDAYGMPTRRTMGSVMDYSYSFDPLKGNLMSRTDNLRNQTETFGYDALNRLTVIDEREITYSDNGNITSIDSVGDMTYDNSAKPYQVTSLTLEEYVVPSRVQNVTYTCYSRPSIMTEGGRSAAFTYNGDGARVKMNVSDGATSVLSRYYIGNQYELDVTPNGTTERLYLGGDAYSAPAVYVKEGSGAWTFYNIGRDYLGNITHIATVDGTLVEENSFDPWGRLRNPETKEIYSLGTEPELMLGRGYTGHEHLTWFGLINMNARLYDPVLGRFLSPDPFVQMPDFTQNFNRYSYCLNNPLVYVDENGELVFTTAIIVGICVSAAIGAGIGIYEGYKIAEKKGLEGSAKTWTIIGGGLIGGVAGGASALVGAYVGAGMVAAEIGGFYAGAITGGAAGATAGFINGFGMGTLETGNPLYGLNQGFYQGTIGGLSGALMGGLIQGTSSAIKGNNFWDGSSNLSHGSSSSNILEYDLEPDPTGGNETLYRGTTGSENSYGELYMTDNYEYASSYVRNGGNVVKIQIPKYTLELMKCNSDLCIKRGINATWNNVPNNEYVFSPKVKASIVIRLKF